MDLKSYLVQRQAVINKALERTLPAARAVPCPIHQAMRYSVLGEGKRIRPILVLAACEAVGGRISMALPSACAVELIHAYSLVHDDLPAMDDDDFRRGRPSTHKRFGEAIGVLAGDALLTYSFEILSNGDSPHPDPSVRLKVIRETARAIGTRGMIGGQVADIRQGRSLRSKEKEIESINTRKTGALIACCVRIGALLGEASPAQYRCLSFYGDRIGLTFQLVDDLLDQDGAVKISGIQAVRQRAQRLTRSAISALRPLGTRADPLKSLAQFILTRGS